MTSWSGSAYSAVVGATTLTITGALTEPKGDAVAVTCKSGTTTLLTLAGDQWAPLGGHVAELIARGEASTADQDCRILSLTCPTGSAGHATLSYSNGAMKLLGGTTEVLSGTAAEWRAFLGKVLDCFVSCADHADGDRHARVPNRSRDVEAGPRADVLRERWNL